METSLSLVWFRWDLRTVDHPAFLAAASTKQTIGVFVLDPALDGRELGSAAKWWLHHSLAALKAQIESLGSILILRRGSSVEHLLDIARTTGAEVVHWNGGTTPFQRTLDQEMRTALEKAGIAAHVHASDLLIEPEAMVSDSGKPYRVFTPFWNALEARYFPVEPIPAPKDLPSPKVVPPSLALDALALLPTPPNWAREFAAVWTPGEAGAENAAAAFLEQIERYRMDRDVPALPATSRLSPHLRFGEISPRRLWHMTLSLSGSIGGPFLREMAWREFARHILFQMPTLAHEPLQPAFAAFPWSDDPGAFAAWTQGKTGYPIVDAGMRQLWRTGWMHNRVRMIVGSFLVKDLLCPWQQGERWFWDTLVDADAASNPFNWQWISGCGADAAPYFRVFNPTLQGEKFDPRGNYVRAWLPELANVHDLSLHRSAPTEGTGYPTPIVDHGRARHRALQAFSSLRK